MTYGEDIIFDFIDNLTKISKDFKNKMDQCEINYGLTEQESKFFEEYYNHICNMYLAYVHYVKNIYGIE